MKKNKIIIVVLAAVEISLICAVSIYSAAAATGSFYIEEIEAIEIAQNDVKTIAAGEQTLLKARLDYDDGLAEYDINIVAGDKKYEYKIDAVSGAIIGRQFEMIKTKPVTATKPTAPASSEYIGEEKAKALVLEFASVSAKDAVFVQCKLDREDGMYVYEIEFFANFSEYEAEVDAVTGDIIDFEMDD